MLVKNDRYDLEVTTSNNKYYRSYFGFSAMAECFKMVIDWDNILVIDIIDGSTGEVLMTYTKDKGVTYISKEYVTRIISNDLI